MLYLHIETKFHNCSLAIILYALHLQKTSRNRNTPTKVQVATIHIHDVSKALSVSKKMAEEYIIDSDNVIGE